MFIEREARPIRKGRVVYRVMCSVASLFKGKTVFELRFRLCMPTSLVYEKQEYEAVHEESESIESNLVIFGLFSVYGE